MARPTRQGVDYFPLDVYLDDKFKFIEIKYKLEGFAILIKLLQKIYSYGYWYSWTEDEVLIFADENRSDLELVESVVDEAIKRDIFDKTLFDKYKILTSSGIQKRYKEIVRRRKDVDVTVEYLLIDNGFGVNTDIVSTLNKQSDNKSTQSKVKESKVKESKVKEIKVNKIKYGEFKKVSLLEEEYKKLLGNLGQAKTDDLIERLDSYKESTGKTYKSDYATILNWHRKELKENGARNNVTEFKGKDEGIAARAGVQSF